MNRQKESAIKMIKLNIITGGVLVIFGLLAFLWVIPNYIPDVEVENIGLKSSFFPNVSVVFLVVLSVILMATNFVKLKRIDSISEEESEENEILGFGRIEIINILIMILGTIIFILLMKFTGFVPASILLISIAMYLAGVRGYKLLLISIFFPFAIKEILWRTLEVMLP